MEDPTSHIHLDLTTWELSREALLDVRTTVFVVEQGVDPRLEEDDLDPLCVHVLATDDHGRPIATGRMTPTGKIGRVAVLPPWRGKGLGEAVVQRLWRAAAAQDIGTLYLDAQLPVIPFYEKLGFVARGPVFPDAAILHRRMDAALSSRTTSEAPVQGRGS